MLILPMTISPGRGKSLVAYHPIPPSMVPLFMIQELVTTNAGYFVLNLIYILDQDR